MMKKETKTSRQQNPNPLKKMHDFEKSEYGQLSLYKDHNNSQLLAIKTYNCNSGSEINQQIQQEVNKVIQIKHHCILPIIKFEFQHQTNKLQIFSSYQKRGSLSDIIFQRKNGGMGQYLNDTWIAITITGIVLGMKYIHSQKMAHSDLKPENILIDAKGQPLICDLLNYNLFKQKLIKILRTVENPYYYAPEIFINQYYCQANDAYSFSIILFELLTNQSAFQNDRDYFNGILPQIPDTINPIIRDIIRQCMDFLPSNRLSFDQIYKKLKDIAFQITPNVDTKQVWKYIDENNLDPKITVQIHLWKNNHFSMDVHYSENVSDIMKRISMQKRIPVFEIEQYCRTEFLLCDKNKTFGEALDSYQNKNAFLQDPIINFHFLLTFNIPLSLLSYDNNLKLPYDDSNDYSMWVEIDGCAIRCNMNNTVEQLLWKYCSEHEEGIQYFYYLEKNGSRLSEHLTLTEAGIVEMDRLKINIVESQFMSYIYLGEKSGKLYIPGDETIRSLKFHMLLATKTKRPIEYIKIIYDDIDLDDDTLIFNTISYRKGTINFIDINPY